MKLGFAIPHEIRIRASANMGFIVKVGCGEFVAKNKQDLLSSIEEYIDDPTDCVEEYNKLPGSRIVEDERTPRPEQASDTQSETAIEDRG